MPLEHTDPITPDDIRYHGELRCRRLTSFGAAALILKHELNRMTRDGVVDRIEPEFHATLRIDAKGRIRPRYDPVMADRDRCAFCNLDDADFVRDGALGFGMDEGC